MPQLSGVERVVNAPLPTVYGDFQAVGYLDHDRGEEQVALVYGDISDGGNAHPAALGVPDR